MFNIVCHSMGYAYALGIIDKLQSANIKFGRFYIIAPENAGSGAVPYGFEEVWQYGSNEKKQLCFLQDGVAPQTQVLGIDNLPSGTIGGRVYIPDGLSTMGYAGSHMISNYGWIFTTIQPGGLGYVKSRK